jgi:hypothetical protein
MTLMVGLHNFFLELSKKCWPRFRVRNSTYIIVVGAIIIFFKCIYMQPTIHCWLLLNVMCGPRCRYHNVVVGAILPTSLGRSEWNFLQHQRSPIDGDPNPLLPLCEAPEGSIFHPNITTGSSVRPNQFRS